MPHHEGIRHTSEFEVEDLTAEARLQHLKLTTLDTLIRCIVARIQHLHRKGDLLMEAPTRDAQVAADVQQRPVGNNNLKHGSANADADADADAVAVAAVVTQPQVGKPKPKQRRRKNNWNAVEDAEDASKRRCVSTACIACR